MPSTTKITSTATTVVQSIFGNACPSSLLELLASSSRSYPRTGKPAGATSFVRTVNVPAVAIV
jgi:hypothetical protein